MALFDLTSAWVEGRCCPLAARGHSRDGKRGKLQVEYGILTDPDGRPVAVRVFDGATGDPTAFTEIVRVVSGKLGLTDLVLVGDRGMITKARVAELTELNNDPDTEANLGWITALRAPTIAKLLRAGAVQLSLFDQQDLAEITHPDFPGERLIACRNPLLATERARTRHDLLAATEKLLAEITDRVRRGGVTGADDIGVAVGKVINKYRMAKHIDYTITDTSLSYRRDQDKIDAEAALDGIYVLRTSVPAHTLDAAGVVLGYKNLAHVERDFRTIKADDVDLRPIYHYLEDRVRAHVLICMLACYLVWHLRKAWAPLTFTDEHPPPRDNPVAPAHRSAHAQGKASSGRDELGNPYRGFRGLLDHLATLTRNQIRYPATTTDIPMLTEPTSDQRHAFELIGAPIPLTLA
jgi:transposase